MSYGYFNGYKEDQFLFLIISLDPWGVLRGFILPDDMIIETNMRGYKKKQGDIEVLLVGDRYSGLSEIDDFKFSVLPPALKHFEIADTPLQPFGYLLIEIGEESTATVKTDPLGVHPIYYGFIGSDVVLSARRKWLEAITDRVFEAPNNSIVELSYRSARVINRVVKVEDGEFSAVDVIIRNLKNILNGEEKDLIYLYRGIELDEKFLRILDLSGLKEIVKILPINSQSKKNLSEFLRKENLDLDYFKILWERSLNKCVNEEDCLEDILLDLRKESLSNDQHKTIVLFHFLKRTDIAEFNVSDNNIINFVKERNLFVWFRRLFNAAWPLAIIDPFFSSKNMLIKGKNLVKKLDV